MDEASRNEKYTVKTLMKFYVLAKRINAAKKEKKAKKTTMTKKVYAHRNGKQQLPPKKTHTNGKCCAE